MTGPVARPLPQGSLLMSYRENGSYTDCFTLDVRDEVSNRQFVQAFYTSRLFKAERFLITWLVGKTSSDDDVARLADGSADRFSAWAVERRAQDQLLLCDYQGRTRSWLMAQVQAECGTRSTRLYFGTAVVPVEGGRAGQSAKPLLFRLLGGVHRLYARELLRAAAANLQPITGPA